MTMMKQAAFGLAALAALAAVAGSAAVAQTAADLAPAFGNTILSTYPSGRQTHLWLERGGTFEGLRSRGQRMSGVWTVNGRGELCLRQRRPVPLPVNYCTPVVRGGVGTRWSAKAPTGETIQVQLVAGQARR